MNRRQAKKQAKRLGKLPRYTAKAIYIDGKLVVNGFECEKSRIVYDSVSVQIEEAGGDLKKFLEGLLSE